jgi:site-specific recombinase XerD
MVCTGKTPEAILADYDGSDERTFRRKYAQIIREWIGQLSQEGLTNTSIQVMVGVVKSFFKYNDLPLGMIPQARSGVTFHNRDITKDEIVKIMAMVRVRQKAFFGVMAQSGLRPHTITQLRLRNLESLDVVPCKITVPEEITKGKFGSYVTFLGPDALKYLKQYLDTRTNLTPDSLLFPLDCDPTKPMSEKDISRAFRVAARRLEKSGALKYEVRAGKPSELRLYTLRKFFRKYANQMGFEKVDYLMGHKGKGVDDSYRPQDPEFYRELYKEKAMPFLRLESATPTETEKTVAELRAQLSQRDEEIEKLKTSVSKIEKLAEFLEHLEPEDMAEFFRNRMEHKQSLTEPPATMEIPIDESRLKILMKKKEREKDDKIYLSELLEASSDPTLREKAKMTNKRSVRNMTKEKAERKRSTSMRADEAH